MGKDIDRQLAEFAVNTKIEDIPQETLTFAKCLTLKTIAGMLAGSETTSAKKMKDVIIQQSLSGDCSVIGGKLKTSLWEAILLGGFFAHAKELEDDR